MTRRKRLGFCASPSLAPKREKRSSKRRRFSEAHHLCEDAADAPDVDGRGVVLGAEEDLGRAVPWSAEPKTSILASEIYK